LVPYMISAASDPSEHVRISALYALTDSREPPAVAELRRYPLESVVEQPFTRPRKGTIQRTPEYLACLVGLAT